MKIKHVNTGYLGGRALFTNGLTGTKQPAYDYDVAPISEPISYGRREPIRYGNVVSDYATAQRRSSPDILRERQEAEAETNTNEQQSGDKLLDAVTELHNTLYACESCNENGEKTLKSKEADCCNAVNSENPANRAVQPLYVTYAGLVFENGRDKLIVDCLDTPAALKAQTGSRQDESIVDYLNNQDIIRETIRRRKGYLNDEHS